MAKYYFWIRTAKNCDYVDVSDEELEGLTEEEKQKLLFDYHDKWCRKQYYGDWELSNKR